MAKLGIMIEGQDDLTWERWHRIIDRVESLGFESLWRSDHLTPLVRDETAEALEAWISFATLADRTNRVRFGPLVTPITFRYPAVLAKMAASIDRLSNGRLEFGLGAAWHHREHKAFGLPYPPMAERFERLEESLQLTIALWTHDNVNFNGKHYRLEDTICHPKPAQSPHPPIIVGGNGKRRTLPLAAKYANEWNGTSHQTPDEYRERRELLRGMCEGFGRDPDSVRCSLMITLLIGRNESDLNARLERVRGIMVRHPEMAQATPASLVENGWIAGTSSQVVEQIQQFEEAGVERFMLQIFDYD
ncbi:MAG: LLM class F420-dependent oxidoreductase, partial [Dehalococcoidia bacterium]